MNIITRLFRKPVSSFDLDIKFHIATNVFGEHGRLVATHFKKNVIEEPIPFVFPGITTPPPMTLSLFNYIWDRAQREGFVPHALLSYGNVIADIEAHRHPTPPVYSCKCGLRTGQFILGAACTTCDSQVIARTPATTTAP